MGVGKSAGGAAARATLFQHRELSDSLAGLRLLGRYFIQRGDRQFSHLSAQAGVEAFNWNGKESGEDPCAWLLPALPFCGATGGANLRWTYC